VRAKGTHFRMVSRRVYTATRQEEACLVDDVVAWRAERGLFAALEGVGLLVLFAGIACAYPRLVAACLATSSWRTDDGRRKWRLFAVVLERGVLLVFFAGVACAYRWLAAAGWYELELDDARRALPL